MFKFRKKSRISTIRKSVRRTVVRMAAVRMIAGWTGKMLKTLTKRSITNRRNSFIEWREERTLAKLKARTIAEYEETRTKYINGIASLS